MEQPCKQPLLKVDVVLMGAGLSNLLLAYRLWQRSTPLTILLLEKCSLEEKKQGEQTWSFHHTDIEKSDQWILPFTDYRWPQYDIQFPRYQRTLQGPYYTISSASFFNKMLPFLSSSIIFNCAVTNIEKKSGSEEIYIIKAEEDHKGTFTIETKLILDGTGAPYFSPTESPYPSGFQKFVGLEVELTHPHGLLHPVLMDVTVKQEKGFHFIYLLPMSERKILVEDTYYEISPHLDSSACLEFLHHYIERKNWKIKNILRQEQGVLPIPLISRPYQDEAFPPTIGMKGGFFHLVTGYSFPSAMELSLKIDQYLFHLHQRNRPLSLQQLKAFIQQERKKNHQKNAYFALLNRMLFLAATPHLSYKILERFYLLNESLIQRFYRGKLTLKDYIRILMGKPPVSLWRALKCLFFHEKSLPHSK